MYRYDIIIDFKDVSIGIFCGIVGNYIYVVVGIIDLVGNGKDYMFFYIIMYVWIWVG